MRVVLVLLAFAVLAHAQPQLRLNEDNRFDIPAGANLLFQASVASDAQKSLLYLHVRCSGASSSDDYNILFQLGTPASPSNKIDGVQNVFWEGVSGSGLSSEHVVPLGQLSSPSNLFGLFTNNRVQPEEDVAVNVTSPGMHYFSISVTKPNSLLTVHLDDSEDDSGTHLRAVLGFNKFPTFADSVIDSCDQFYGRENEQTECLISAPTAGTYIFGVFTTENGVALSPPREIWIYVAVSPDAVDLQTGAVTTVTLPPNGNSYFLMDVDSEGYALFLRVTSSISTAATAMFAKNTFPTEASSLQYPEVRTSIDSTDPAAILAVSVIEESVLKSGTWHIRIYNPEFEPVTFSVQPILAPYARVLPGDQDTIALPPGTDGLFRTILDGTDNVLQITVVASDPLKVWIQKDAPPLIFSSSENFATSVSQQADGKTVTRYIWSPSGGSPEGTWYFRVIPTSKTANTTTTMFTMTITSGYLTELSEFGQLGGRLPYNAVDYYSVAVPLSNTFGLYVRVDYHGALSDSLFNLNGFPTEQQKSSKVASWNYQVNWAPVAGVCEYVVKPADLPEGNWTFSVAASDPDVEISYALASVLFEVFPITAANTVQRVQLSQRKMSVLSYAFQPQSGHLSDDLSISISPADTVNVIVARDNIPFTFKKDPSVISVKDNTITLTIPSATAGTYYFRVTAEVVEKEVSAAISIGKQVPIAAPLANNVSPSSDNLNGNLFMILIVVFLGLLVIILAVVLVVFISRNKQSQRTELSSIGSSDAKYSLLDETIHA